MTYRCRFVGGPADREELVFNDDEYRATITQQGIEYIWWDDCLDKVSGSPARYVRLYVPLTEEKQAELARLWCKKMEEGAA